MFVARVRVGVQPNVGRPGSAHEPACDKLAPKLRGIAVSLLPAAVAIPSIGAENANASRVAPERGNAGAQPTPDRLAFGADEAGDAFERQTGRRQSRGLLIARLPPRIEGLPVLRGRRYPD